MSGPFICARCRTRIHRFSRGYYSIKSTSRASFVSLNQPQPKIQNDRVAAIEEPSLELPERISLPLTRPTTYPRRREYRDRTDGALQSLFRASAGESSRSHRNFERKTPQSDIRYSNSIPIQKLQQNLSDPQCSVQNSWQILRENYANGTVPKPRKPFKRPKGSSQERDICKQLLQRTVEAFAGQRELSGIPSPSQALYELHNLRLIGLEEWTDTLWSLLRHCEDSIACGPEHRTERRGESMLQNIFEVWNILFSIDRAEGMKMPLPNNRDHAFFPTNKQLHALKAGLSRDFSTRFLYFLPQSRSSKVGPSLAFAAYATFDLQQRQLSHMSLETAESREFLRFMCHLVAYGKPNFSSMKDFVISKGVSAEYVAKVLERTIEAPQAALQLLAKNASLGHADRSGVRSEDGDQTNHKITFFMRQLKRATERNDIVRVDSLWHEIPHHFPAHNDFPNRSIHSDGGSASQHRPVKLEFHSNSAIPLTIYTRFLSAYMSLRQPDRAIDVWNEMITAGHSPSILAWHAMMEGCRAARDAASLEQIWQRMVLSGVKPDIQCWTTRVSGLMRCNKKEAGVKALFEMGRLWLECTKRAQRLTRDRPSTSDLLTSPIDIEGVIKPTIETVNAALGPLVAQEQDALAKEVLLWAQSFNIQYDIVTFNMLLRRAVRKGQDAEARTLLACMEAQQILPDVATFSILLDGLFQNDMFIASSPVEQQSLITSILGDMEASGVKANVYSYGILIDRLLKQCLNLPAARAVLDHMASRKIKASPHIYTIILTHYFDQESPDLVAIDSLWERIKLEGGVVDLIFCDRLIEGYARTGQTSKMMAFLGRMPSEGKVPGWNALSAVLRALIRNEEWEMIKRVIEDVESEDGCFKHGIRGLKGEVEFWELVQTLRLDGTIPFVTAGQGLQSHPGVVSSAPLAPSHS
ncbi:hypothetical protein L228DRAFT_244878 [Xylona heveae TC161]|uniref:Pentatricopeptide repeat protein n=1 Tax=Xylona heveae (strain CBS 132557 / TC161) TaxID=1328760 RepID=A0A165HWB3_XYLHT|nr:hypothetical protein L228DRAFT_244878 [Xylona heveae TC161]KZF24015.1 hypothetical protein L228DRAFT_244878 [Xylona heveae TC161]